MIGNRQVLPLDASKLPRIGRATLALRRSQASGLGLSAGKVAADALGKELSVPATLSSRLLEPPVGLDALPAGACILQLSLASLGVPALLLVEEGLAAALAQSLGTGAPPAPHAPGPLSRAEAVATSFLALCVLRALREAGPVELPLAPRFVRLVRMLEELDAPLRHRSWLAIDLELQVGGVRGELELLLPPEVAPRLASATTPAAAGPLPGCLRLATLPASLFAGRAELEHGEVASLAPGDVVLLGGLSRGAEGLAGPARLLFHGFTLHGRLDGRQLALEAIESVSMETSPRPPPLPVQVEVELAQLRIALGELERVKPGEVLTLERGLSEPVVLRIGARAFATAELVDVEGELGARILALAGEE